MKLKLLSVQWCILGFIHTDLVDSHNAFFFCPAIITGLVRQQRNWGKEGYLLYVMYGAIWIEYSSRDALRHGIVSAFGAKLDKNADKNAVTFLPCCFGSFIYVCWDLDRPQEKRRRILIFIGREEKAKCRNSQQHKSEPGKFDDTDWIKCLII